MLCLASLLIAVCLSGYSKLIMLANNVSYMSVTLAISFLCLFLAIIYLYVSVLSNYLSVWLSNYLSLCSCLHCKTALLIDVQYFSTSLNLEGKTFFHINEQGYRLTQLEVCWSQWQNQKITYVFAQCKSPSTYCV